MRMWESFIFLLLNEQRNSNHTPYRWPSMSGNAVHGIIDLEFDHQVRQQTREKPSKKAYHQSLPWPCKGTDPGYWHQAPSDTSDKYGHIECLVIFDVAVDYGKNTTTDWAI